MNTYDLTPIIQVAIVLIGTIITSFLIPWIKSKVTQEQWWIIQDITKVAVRAAEILYKGSGRGEEKLEYVTAYVKEFCAKNGFSIDDKSIRQTIESEVKKMNYSTNEFHINESKSEISE